MKSEVPQGEDEGSLGRRLLTVAVAGGLVLALLGVVAVSLTPAGSTDPYTEFYVLGPDGIAADYPTTLAVGESGTVTVGISNHETGETRYTLLVALDGEETARQSVTLDRGESWEGTVSVSPRHTGTQLARLALFDGDAGPPSTAQQSLRLWINATESSAKVPK